MAQIVLLAFAAAVFPTLIACVAIMITRPEPRRLLLAFYLGGMAVSLTAGAVLLRVFHQGNTALGNSSSHVSPGASIAAGVLALVIAGLLVSARGRERMQMWRARHSRRRPADAAAEPSWAERHLGNANVTVAFAVGAAINLPGPFYLLALGDIATGSYSTAQEAALVLLFNIIMFLLLEVPLVGYLLRPEETAVRVARLGAWLDLHALELIGWLVGLSGVSLLVQGIAAAT